VNRGRAFTLIELLVVVAVVGVLLSLLLPSLRGARESARTAACLSNQRQLLLGWSLYAADYAGRALPAGDEHAAAPDVLYWWGAVIPGPPADVDHARGFLTPYLSSDLAERSAYECPSQPWGSYRAQPMNIAAPGRPTSTYGYNGYYLSPPMTPGWSLDIGRQPWKRLSDLERPSDLFVFADAMLPVSPARNDPFLDPPMLFSSGAGGGWSPDQGPTTSFRHGAAPGSAATARADGGARVVRAQPQWLFDPTLRIGSVGLNNDPYYVPDWRRWQ
jgi:prepilin-type N-terminal cleavage/methylation domain-containing protein